MSTVDLDPGSLFASLIVSGVGYVLCAHGRKTPELSKVFVGIVASLWVFDAYTLADVTSAPARAFKNVVQLVGIAARVPKCV